MKRSALKRGKPLQRKARLKAWKVPKAFQKRRDPAYRSFIRTLPCLLWSRTPPDCGSALWEYAFYVAVDCAHVRSRGAAGDDRGNCVPLCRKHHMQQHRLGIKSFQARWGLDLGAEAARLYQQYLAEVGRA